MVQLELEGVRRLAECAVRRMMESVRVGCLNCDDNSSTAIVEKLLTSIVVVDKKPGILALKHQEIPTLVPKPKKHRWSEANVFKKPGLKTLSGEYYSGPMTDVSQFGYRLGTAEEAKALGYSLDNLRKAATIDLAVPCYHTPPKARSVLSVRSATLKNLSGKPPSASPPVPPKRLFSRAVSVPMKPSTEQNTVTPPKRRGSKAEVLMFELVEQVEKAETAVSPQPLKNETAVGPSPVKVLDPAQEDMKQRMSKMEEMMGQLLAQGAQIMGENAQLKADNAMLKAQLAELLLRLPK